MFVSAIYNTDLSMEGNLKTRCKGGNLRLKPW